VTDFTLPELGENVPSGDVLRVLVKAGDVIAKDQPVLELETDKATIEVPSSVAGRVKEIKVKAGDKVKVGQSILAVDAEAAPAEDAKAGAAPSATSAPVAAESAPAADASAAPEVQPSGSAAAGANSTAQVPEDEPGLEQHVQGDKRPTPDKPGTTRSRGDNVVAISRARPANEPTAPELPVAPAAPSVRRMARELGVDIDQVPGSGSGGRISVEDVKAHAKRIITEPAPARTGVPVEPLPDFSRWGQIERQPLRAVRRKTAEHLSFAWATVPHVTQHDSADITTLEMLRKRYAKQAESAGGSLTITAIAVKVAAAALRVFPQFNSSIDLANDAIISKKYVNIGVAVDTDRGLLVPVIRHADTKNIVQLSVELTQLSEKARTRKISLDEMQGGCFSISNLGGIGGSFFTPIVNTPEVAILGISRAKMEPVHDPATNQFTPRLMLPLSLSYDHRVIDGADGIRFLRWVVEALEQPFVLALQG
jgi:pyruvate dehydrogenase E2 component (dihydrolipoamide acetyltransferase)